MAQCSCKENVAVIVFDRTLIHDPHAWQRGTQVQPAAPLSCREASHCVGAPKGCQGKARVGWRTLRPSAGSPTGLKAAGGVFTKSSSANGRGARWNRSISTE